MTVETDPINTKYFEGNFWLHVVKFGKRCTVYMGHHCPKSSNSALIRSELMNNQCQNCGTITIPDSLKTLWVLYNS